MDLTARLSKDEQTQAGEVGEALGADHHPGLGGIGPTAIGERQDPGMGGGWSPSKQHDEAEVRGEVVASLDSLTIVEQAGQITITDQSGHARLLKTDGSKVRDQGPAGAAQLRASWDRDGSLVIEVRPEKGTRRTESDVVSDDRKPSGRARSCAMETAASGERFQAALAGSWR